LDKGKTTPAVLCLMRQNIHCFQDFRSGIRSWIANFQWALEQEQELVSLP